MKNLILFFIFTSILGADLAWVQKQELIYGRGLEQTQKVEEALQLYSNLYQRYPRDTRVFSALKRVYFRLERYDEFIALIDEAYEENPMPGYALALGEANLRKGRAKDSGEWFAEFLEKKNAEASFHKVASIYASEGMLEEAAKTYEEGRKKLENDVLFAREIAVLYRKDDIERSLKECIKLYRAVPEERVWVERTLKQEVKEGNQTAILKVIREEIDSHRNEKELRILLGDILVELDDYESALDEYRLSEEARALLWLAKECKEEGKFDLAFKAYEGYLEKNPSSIEAYMGMGDCFSATGNYEKAEEFYEKTVGVAEGEDAISALYRLAELKMLRGDFAGARHHYRDIEENFPFAATEAVFRTIDSYTREGNFVKAEAECERALEYDETRAHYLLAETNYYRGKLTEAREYYTKVIDHNPNSIWVNDSMERLILLGAPDEELRVYVQAEALLLQSKYDESIEVSKNLLKETPSSEISPHAIFLIARAYEERGKPTVAVEGYRDVIDNYPESYLCPHAQYRIGYIYLNDLKDIGNAREEMETVLFKYPESMIAEKVRHELRDLE